MANNFIQMAASADRAVAYTIGPIFKHIIDSVQMYFTNGFTNIQYVLNFCFIATATFFATILLFYVFHKHEFSFAWSESIILEHL